MTFRHNIRWAVAGDKREHYEFADDHVGPSGIPLLPEERHSTLHSETAPSDAIGVLFDWFSAERYRGKRLRMKAEIRTLNCKGGAGAWLRIDGPHESILDNMENRLIQDTQDWQTCELVVSMPAQARKIVFGLLIKGAGQARIRNVVFDEVDQSVSLTAPT